MLERDFTTLDDDFITVWSDFFLNHDKYKTKAKIEYLAEMGQINSVQSWYLFEVEGKNKNIDHVYDYILSKGDKDDFNILLMRQNREDKLGIDRKVRSIKMTAHLGGISTSEADKEVLDLPYFKLAKQIFLAAENEYLTTKNPLVWERAIEILTANIAHLPHSSDERVMHAVYPRAKKVRSVLLKMYNEEKKKNPKLTPVDIPQLAFALGKNCYQFAATQKYKKLGEKLLFDLSRRPMSTMFEVYKNKREKEKEAERERANKKAADDFVNELKAQGGLEEVIRKRAREMDGIFDDDDEFDGKIDDEVIDRMERDGMFLPR